MTMFSIEMYQSQSDQRAAEISDRLFAPPEATFQQQKPQREDYIISLQDTVALRSRREGSPVKFTPRFEEQPPESSKEQQMMFESSESQHDQKLELEYENLAQRLDLGLMSLQPTTPDVVKGKAIQASTPLGNSVPKNKEGRVLQSEE